MRKLADMGRMESRIGLLRRFPHWDNFVLGRGVDAVGVGERIQAAREQKTLSRPKLAELLGVKPNTIWLWENGERQPSDDDKHRLAQILGVSIAYLMGEDVVVPQRGKRDDAIVSVPILSTEYLVVPGAGVERKLSSIAMQHITPSPCPSYVQKHARRVRFPLDLYAQARIISLAPRGTGAQNLGRRWEK